MRIAFYSPMPPERSGIADYSYELLEELRHHLDVVAVVRDDRVGVDRAPEGVEVVGISSARFEDVDCDVYQMGNNPRYHRFLFQRALDQPGLLVLHDPSLADFHAEMCRYPESGVFRAEIEYDNPEFALDSPLPLVDIGRGARDLDRLEVLLARRIVTSSIRTLVHSSAVASAMRDRYRGCDIATIQLPAPVVGAGADATSVRPPGAVVFGVFGGVNYYKRIDSVVEAFKVLHNEYPLARLVVAGRPDDRRMAEDLARLAAGPELGGRLEVKTELSLAELEAEMVACDVAISLRWPTAGEMSATLMRAFGAGRPAIVTDVLQFRELDEQFCWRVPVGDDESASLLELMRRAARDPGAIAAAGRLAQSFVAHEATYRVVGEQYLDHIRSASPRRLARRAEVWPYGLAANAALGVNLLELYPAQCAGSDGVTRGLGALRAAGVDVVVADLAKQRALALPPGRPRRDKAPVPGRKRPRGKDGEEGARELPSHAARRDPVQAAEAFALEGRARARSVVVEDLHEIDLCYADSHRAGVLGDLLRRRHRRGRRTVAVLSPEALPLSTRFTRLLRHADEIWVPSAFVADLVAGAFSAPVVVVPFALAARPGTPPAPGPAPRPRPTVRSELVYPRGPGKPVQVLTVADATRGLAPGNPWGSIAAFLQAFPGPSRDGGVELCVVARHLRGRSEARDRLVNELERAGGRLLEEDSGDAISELIAGCDVFVSLHRTESFGIWSAAAMAAGRPVVATAFGGNLDYMTTSNACLVGFDLVPISEGDFYLDAPGEWGFELGQSWALPNIDQAASWLRLLAAHEDLRGRIGAAAQGAVEGRLDARAVGSLMRDRLEALGHRSPRDEAIEKRRAARLPRTPATGVSSSLGACR